MITAAAVAGINKGNARAKVLNEVITAVMPVEEAAAAIIFCQIERPSRSV
jgi:hypothetical protein